MTFESLKTQIEQVGRFESLVHLPDKPRDLDWPKWVARATVDGHGTNGEGDTDIGAMKELFQNLQK